MFVNSSNWEDVRKYYEKTFVKFPVLTNDQLWFIDRVTSDLIEVRATNGDEAAIDLSKGYEMDFVIPKKTVYQYGECAVMLSRIPARQWKKGMCKANTSFQILTTNGWTNGSFDAGIIEGFINKPSYFSPYEAFEKFEQSPELQSAALTPRISMTAKGAIYIDEVMIGKFQQLKAGPQLAVKNIFVPEMVKLFYKKVNIKAL